jgi:predicted O-methyltransferase YrrM
MSSYVGAAINDPLSGLTYIIGGKDKLIKKKICDSLKVSSSMVSEYYDHAKSLDFIPSEYKIANIGQIASPEVLYTICRILKPEVVVETGVASGLSSAYILKALSDNAKGKLISIDMPNHENELMKTQPCYLENPQAIIPEDKQTGWVVPQNLRNRWVLKLGLVQDLLIPALNELGAIDIFLHDSEHSYENMMFEFRNAWKCMRNGGILLSHDITWNSSFSNFASESGRRYEPIYFTGMGAIRK